jgi:hypothetical protein
MSVDELQQKWFAEYEAKVKELHEKNPYWDINKCRFIAKELVNEFPSDEWKD